MDMFTLLKQDHEEAKTLLEEILEKEEIDKTLVNQVCEALLLHMDIEEKYLYPVMKKQEGAEEITAEAQEEHKEARKVIEELMSGKLRSETKLKVKLEILQLEIEHHVEEEETELFPQIEKSLSQEEIDSIGQKMLKLKESRLQEKETVKK